MKLTEYVKTQLIGQRNRKWQEYKSKRLEEIRKLYEEGHTTNCIVENFNYPRHLAYEVKENLNLPSRKRNCRCFKHNENLVRVTP